MVEALYKKIYDQAEQIVNSRLDAQPISGTSLGIDQDIADSVKFTVEDGGTAQVSVSRPEARPPLEWRVELTFYIGTPDQYRHYLLMDDGTILHAIGKQIRPVEEDEAETIVQRLEQLASLPA